MIPNEQSTHYALRNESNYDMKINPAEITNHKKQTKGFLLQFKAKHSRNAPKCGVAELQRTPPPPPKSKLKKLI
jgi:hypothetical protein